MKAIWILASALWAGPSWGAELEAWHGSVRLPCAVGDADARSAARQEALDAHASADYRRVSVWKEQIRQIIGGTGSCTGKIAESYAYFVAKAAMDEEWTVRTRGAARCSLLCGEEQQVQTWSQSLARAQDEARFACNGALDAVAREVERHEEFPRMFVTVATFGCDR